MFTSSLISIQLNKLQIYIIVKSIVAYVLKCKEYQMKCKVCGAESGKYPLCRVCNQKKEKGEIIKCPKCGNWHYAASACTVSTQVNSREQFIYEAKQSLISNVERQFYEAIKATLPVGYRVFPQINLAAFITKNDNTRFHNELFRNVDYLITDEKYKPVIVIEINDQSHLDKDRQERDTKVKNICEEAGIPILKLWTSYGANQEYIGRRISEVLTTIPVARVHHFDKVDKPHIIVEPPKVENTTHTYFSKRSSVFEKNGCYIATSVYGSYDCPEVWVLRRYRDNVLLNSCFGRWFVKRYYAISPLIVDKCGNKKWFVKLCKSVLDKIVNRLQAKGFDNTSYNDKM